MSYKVKVCLIGDFGVGKSSIINTLQNKAEYCCQSTLGVDFCHQFFTLDNHHYKFHIWDTAGQERFRAIVRSYFRDLDVVILVIDVTNIYGLDNIDKWNTDIEHINNNENVIKIMVGNKIDSSDRCIDRGVGEKMANEYGYTYLETSCKKKHTVENLFQEILKMVHKKHQNTEIKLGKSSDAYHLPLQISNKKIFKKKFSCCQIL